MVASKCSCSAASAVRSSVGADMSSPSITDRLVRNQCAAAGSGAQPALTGPSARGFITDHLVGKARGTTVTTRLGAAPDAALLDPAERMGVDELRALQLERLRGTLGHAYANVPHYRRVFDAAGVHPDDCRELADLAKFPTTSKADLRENYPFGMFAVPTGEIRRVHASSGTTGRPTVVGYTQGDLDVWSDAMARSIRAAGGRPGDLVHVAYGYGLFTGGLGAHYGAERLGCTVVPVSGGMTPRQAQLITDFRPL